VLKIEIQRVEPARFRRQGDVDRARMLDHEGEPDLACAQPRSERIRELSALRLCL
jgi:hypothetical protein